MPDEQTPLLNGEVAVDQETLRAEVDHEAVYKRFTEGKKLFILFMISWGALIPSAWACTCAYNLILTVWNSVRVGLVRAFDPANRA